MRTDLHPSPDSGPVRRLERLSTAITAATTILVFAWAKFAGISIDLVSLLPALGAIVLAACLGIYYRRWRPDERLSTTCIALAQLIAFPVVALPLSYLAATLAHPFADAAFVRWDAALGLDWRRYLEFAHAHPTLGTAMTWAYNSLAIQMILVALLGLAGRAYALQRFLVAHMLTALVSIAISAVLPAVAAVAHFGIDPAHYPNLALSAARVHLADIEALRSGAMKTITLTDAQGIITFPSMHAALGMLFLVAFWSVRWLRWPGLALNVLMIAATPIDGSHYFVDVLAGLAITGLALLAADALAHARLRAPAAVPEPRPA